MVRPGRGGEIFPCETKIYANITVLHYQRIKGESAVTQNTALRLGDIQGAVRVSEDSREEGVECQGDKIPSGSQPYIPTPETPNTKP